MSIDIGCADENCNLPINFTERKRITRSMNITEENSYRCRVDLSVAHNLEYLVKQKYKIKKDSLSSSLPNPHYTKTTKLHVILYDYLKFTSTTCAEYELCVFRNPVLTIQLYLLPNVLKQFNLFANYYQQKMKLSIPSDVRDWFASMIKSNDVILSRNMIMENLDLEYIHLHKLFGRMVKNTLESNDWEMRKRIRDVFIALDEAIDIMNEDMLNDCIPLLEKKLVY